MTCENAPPHEDSATCIGCAFVRTHEIRLPTGFVLYPPCKPQWPTDTFCLWGPSCHRPRRSAGRQFCDEHTAEVMASLHREAAKIAAQHDRAPRPRPATRRMRPRQKGAT